MMHLKASKMHACILREGSCYQIGRVFGKVPKGGRVIFNPKNYVTDFGNFKQGFLCMKLMQKE